MLGHGRALTLGTDMCDVVIQRAEFYNFLAMHASTNLHRFLLITSEDLNTLLFILITENALGIHNKEHFLHVIISVIFLYYLSS